MRRNIAAVMRCRHCQTKMQVQGHRPHKQEKWRCPQCGAARMKSAAYRRAGRRND